MSKLVFCFDGTWNGRDDLTPTNIRRLHRGLRTRDQVSFYFAGPGNEDENDWLGEKLGGAFGWGSDGIRDDAIKVLEAVYRPFDSISVFGFSRGATIARMFCGHVAKEGVNGFSPGISFLGCFDTVAAFLPFGPAQQGIWHDLHVHEKVKTVCHALALDEDRKTFEPNLMNKRDNITEMWFRGVHADIGGGFEDSRLSDVVLGWMKQRAWTSAGLYVGLEKELKPGPKAPVHIMDGLWRRADRKVGVKVDDEWSDLKPEIY